MKCLFESNQYYFYRMDLYYFITENENLCEAVEVSVVEKREVERAQGSSARRVIGQAD